MSTTSGTSPGESQHKKNGKLFKFIIEMKALSFYNDLNETFY